MKKYLLLLFVLSPLLSGCGSVWAEAVPIDALAQVETVGLDPNDAGVALSVCVSSPELRETAAGASIRFAMDAMAQQTGSAALFYAHTKYLLLGAGADIPAALDFVARSSDMRMRTPVLLLKNASAAEAIQLGEGETNVTQMLTALQEGAPHRIFTCGEVLRRLSASGCGMIAAAELRDDTLRNAGYGILKNGVCVGWVAPEDAAAVDLLLSLGGSLDIPLSPGVTVTIEEHRCSRSEGKAELTLRAVLAENGAGISVSDPAARRAMEKALCEEVLRQVQEVLRTCQALGADPFDADGEMTVIVKAVITRSLDLVDPIDMTGANP